MGDVSFSVYFTTGGQEADLAGFHGAVGLDPTPLPLKVHHNLGLLGTGPVPLPEAVLAFLVAAVGVWAADKLALRQAASDAWTRRLLLSCPAPGWTDALAALSSSIGFLTGDTWTLLAREEPPFLELQPRPDESWLPDAVCLFSGGVDSLAGALDLLEAGHKVLLVSHYDFGQLAASQKLLTAGLTRYYGPDRVRRWGFRLQFEAPELSLRSRSLLFMALGLAAASVWGRTLPLFLPENGWISLNPPLTGNRLGSYTTRTTHPHFLSGLQPFFLQVGIAQDLVNPFQFRTKGELLAHSRNPALLRTLLPSSLSCAHPVAARWQKDRQGNCGYCFPCLLRRAALHAVGWDDGNHYLVDVLRQPEALASRTRGADLRSLLYLLRQWRQDPRPQPLLWQTGPLPDPAVAPNLTHLIGRGLDEMNCWLEMQGGDFLRSYAGF